MRFIVIFLVVALNFIVRTLTMLLLQNFSKKNSFEHFAFYFIYFCFVITKQTNNQTKIKRTGNKGLANHFDVSLTLKMELYFRKVACQYHFVVCFIQ